MSLEVSSRGGFGSFEAGWERLCEFSSEESGKSVDVEARSRGESKRPVVERDEELAEFCQKKNILVCDDEMMRFEGGDRLEKSEGMELTCCEEYDIMLEYVC